MTIESARHTESASAHTADIAAFRRHLLGSSGKLAVAGDANRQHAYRTVSGIQTAQLIPADALIFYVEHLEAVPLHALPKVRAVFYLSKGMNCHVCRRT